MLNLDYHRTVIGYHGCDASVVQDVVVKGMPLHPSRNDYDWLGSGVYFWEFGPARALEFAKAKAKRDAALKRTPVRESAVLGAYINLGRCFDLADVRYTDLAHAGHAGLVRACVNVGTQVPRNVRGKGGASDDLLLRYLDCAVMNHALEGASFDTVRGIFVEGAPAFDGAGFAAKSHVQIAVRNPGAVIGYFVPG